MDIVVGKCDDTTCIFDISTVIDKQLVVRVEIFRRGLLDVMNLTTEYMPRVVLRFFNNESVNAPQDDSLDVL